MKEQAEAVQRMQDYIGEHRNETLLWLICRGSRCFRRAFLPAV